jgi:predicted ATPase/class 3 adenylate cyclase
VQTAVPTGTITFLFTDIEGSTRLWQQQPLAMKGALDRHHALLQQAIESHGGYVFQIVGDAFCAAFHTVGAGLRAALAAQRALVLEPWTDTGPIRVRMALHTGTAELRAGEHRSGEYASGLTLSHTARLLSVAHGGQILVSSATHEMLREDVPLEVAMRDLGRHRLRDLLRAEPIYQVVAPDLPGVFPALDSQMALSNLPRQLTSFVGRTREMAEVMRRLGETHLLTVTGPGGSGKTRLALEAATALIADYPDGVWLLELAPIADPGLTAQVLATTLGLREQTGRPLPATLVDHLRSRRALLVFDNCEHVIEACASLADTLLRACPDVRVLASSREPLGVAGEVVIRVPPLAVPDLQDAPLLDRLARNEAIRLFVDRALAVKPDFMLTEAAAPDVAQICRRLDGIPLAIELAAARVRTLSVHHIAAHLDERFRLLTGGSRTALPRHQTLRGLIDWSYDLLAEPERVLFRRLSVFVGGWPLEAAEAVGAGQEVDSGDVVDLLGRLVDKSLVVMDERGADVRYHMLETIRQYALERLTEAADEEAVRARHRDVHVQLAETAEQRLHGAEQRLWLERLESDHDNLRAALRGALDRRETEPALRLASALWLFWDTRWYVREGREWLDEVLALAGERPPAPPGRRSLARVLDGAAHLRARWSELEPTIDLQTRALAVWRELGDTRGIAGALNHLGDQLRQRGDRAGGRARLEESLTLFRELGDKRGIAHALINLGEMLVEDGQHARARSLFEDSVPLLEESADRRGLSHALDTLGGILTLQGEHDRAEALYTRSLQLAEELVDSHGIATALRSLAGVAHRRRDHARAHGLYADSVERFERMNDVFCLARSLVGLTIVSHAIGDHAGAQQLGDRGLALLRASGAWGELAVRLDELGLAALERGDAVHAARHLCESLTLRAAAQDGPGIVASLEHLARAAAAAGLAHSAVRWLAAAETWRRSRGLPGPDADPKVDETIVARARTTLDETAFQSSWAQGAALSLEQLIAEMRGHLGDPPAT